MRVEAYAIRVARQRYAVSKNKALVFVFLNVRSRTTTIQSCTKRLQASLALVLIVCAVAHSQEQQIRIAGVVSDPTGAVIAQASVTFETSAGVVRTRTDDRGEFALLSDSAAG